MTNEIGPNELVELNEYKIISKFFKAKDDDNDTNSLLYLPTPESFEKLCNSHLVKEVINFNLKKYESFFSSIEEENPDDAKFAFDLDKIKYIINRDILTFILFFLGAVNSINTIYDILDDDGAELPSNDIYIDNSPNYLQYIYSITDFLRKNEKFYIPYGQMPLFFKSLDELGFHIEPDDKNILYRTIKDSFFLMEKNKILILVAPSNNFWIKCAKNDINGQYYDIKLNNYNNIYYNKKFIKKFMSKIARHPRCNLGIISSMNYRNLKHCWEALEKQFSQDCPKKVIVIDQNDHEQIMLDPNKKKMSFFRNMKKIIGHLKRLKEKEIKTQIKKKVIDEDTQDTVGEEENDIECFNEKNIIILESEEDKAGPDTKSNSYMMNVFNEQYLESNEKQRKDIDLEGDKAINFIMNLLENCTDDIRQYINRNKNEVVP